MDLEVKVVAVSVAILWVLPTSWSAPTAESNTSPVMNSKNLQTMFKPIVGEPGTASLNDYIDGIIHRFNMRSQKENPDEEEEEIAATVSSSPPSTMTSPQTTSSSLSRTKTNSSFFAPIEIMSLVNHFNLASELPIPENLDRGGMRDEPDSKQKEPYIINKPSILKELANRIITNMHEQKHQEPLVPTPPSPYATKPAQQPNQTPPRPTIIRNPPLLSASKSQEQHASPTRKSKPSSIIHKKTQTKVGMPSRTVTRTTTPNPTLQYSTSAMQLFSNFLQLKMNKSSPSSTKFDLSKLFRDDPSDGLTQKDKQKLMSTVLNAFSDFKRQKESSEKREDGPTSVTKANLDKKYHDRLAADKRGKVHKMLSAIRKDVDAEDKQQKGLSPSRKKSKKSKKKIDRLVLPDISVRNVVGITALGALAMGVFAATPLLPSIMRRGIEADEGPSNSWFESLAFWKNDDHDHFHNYNYNQNQNQNQNHHNHGYNNYDQTKHFPGHRYDADHPYTTAGHHAAPNAHHPYPHYQQNTPTPNHKDDNYDPPPRDSSGTPQNYVPFPHRDETTKKDYHDTLEGGPHARLNHKGLVDHAAGYDSSYRDDYPTDLDDMTHDDDTYDDSSLPTNADYEQSYDEDSNIGSDFRDNKQDVHNERNHNERNHRERNHRERNHRERNDREKNHRERNHRERHYGERIRDDRNHDEVNHRERHYDERYRNDGIHHERNPNDRNHRKDDPYEWAPFDLTSAESEQGDYAKSQEDAWSNWSQSTPQYVTIDEINKIANQSLESILSGYRTHYSTKSDGDYIQRRQDVDDIERYQDVDDIKRRQDVITPREYLLPVSPYPPVVHTPRPQYRLSYHSTQNAITVTGRPRHRSTPNPRRKVITGNLLYKSPNKSSRNNEDDRERAHRPTFELPNHRRQGDLSSEPIVSPPYKPDRRNSLPPLEKTREKLEELWLE